MCKEVFVYIDKKIQFTVSKKWDTFKTYIQTCTLKTTKQH